MLSTPADPDRATVRELIVELAQVEDAMRHDGIAAAAESVTALAEREQVIVAALHRRGLPFHAQGAGSL
ncbi:hypothetical protein GCM10027449_10570 [Sinomonas notoginsengisoli]|uniref:hypothetical protein n=1 Tax=Sinomonas notoginsengisoli TaxID=1457311 RepID=UPI001F455245|nr:hypothetical protein [Sinomonas notoginsengisoli]